MLDEKTRTMLEAANTLTAEDLEFLESDPPAGEKDTDETTAATPSRENKARRTAKAAKSSDVPSSLEQVVPAGATQGKQTGRRRSRTVSRQPAPRAPDSPPPIERPAAKPLSRGEYERSRTRESKVSTACLGHEREKHEWWPLGAELFGELNGEQFTATVVGNPRVKSGRSLVITSGPAQNAVCLTPTRAAIEATEAYRQTHRLGRGGGVTNGWTFWKPKVN